MPGAAAKHMSTAVWAPPRFLQWHAVPQTHLMHCPTTTIGVIGRAGWLLAWVAVAPLCVFRRGNSGFGAVGVLATAPPIKQLTADLLLTRRVPYYHQPGAGLAGWAKKKEASAAVNGRVGVTQ
jgi:hypothetical protein